ncbi:hypothetical protein [Mycobacterium sp.]|uniref:hypothetical protein n=1 Tax=Mycobacterium sp. TaxID=1785 RepID=UPI002DAA5F5A|nr:hypothetical protein [Mycobacterium sp.]
MDTEVDEIGTDVYRLSTFVPEITESGFTFNQFLLLGDEPFLFYCGHRQVLPLVPEAINRVVPLEKLRWISFGDGGSTQGGRGVRAVCKCRTAESQR